MNIKELIEKHKCTIENRQELKKADKCGCFYCQKEFDYNEIKEWTDNNQTAICPNCGVDSVIANPSKNDLKMLNKYYFSRFYHEEN